jgi:hypothetical protein
MFYSYERASKDLAPLGAKYGSRNLAEAAKSGLRSYGARSQERTGMSCCTRDLSPLTT